MNPRGEQPGATLAAIEGIYRSQLPEFRRAAAAITGDRELACDAVQDAFARAVRRHAGFRGEGSLNGWIWRIVINTTLSQTRARRPTSPLAGDPSTSDNGHTDAASERVRSALALLPERQRLILFLHYSEASSPAVEIVTSWAPRFRSFPFRSGTHPTAKGATRRRSQIVKGLSRVERCELVISVRMLTIQLRPQLHRLHRAAANLSLKITAELLISHRRLRRIALCLLEPLPAPTLPRNPSA
jgi:RNA polymerase sigma factor (sigma-70 family)